MPGEKQFDLFLSYNSNDELWVRRLKTALAARGFKVWLAPDEIVAGEQFPSAIERGMAECQAIALVFSPESVASGWVKEEYNTALVLINRSTTRIPLIPLLLRTAELPLFVSSRQYVDFRVETAFDTALEKLVAALPVQAAPEVLPRVCVISSEYPPLIYGGLGIHVEKLTAALAGHMNVDVLLPEPDRYHNLVPRVRPIAVRTTATYDVPGSWIRFAKYAAEKVAAMPQQQIPDVIHCHDWVTVLAGIKCRWLLNIPMIFHVHLPNRSPLCASIENLGLVCADMVTVNSDFMFVEISDRGLPIQALHVVRNGVDMDVFHPAANWPADGGYILFVGRLVEQKGVEYLLRAFCYIRQKFPDLRLKIVGIGEFKEWLERLADNLMLSSHVDFIKWTGHKDLAKLYQEARVVVVPSIFEPFGMVALEAMACKRPVVASRTGGLKEIVRHGKSGFLAEPKDHLDLAQWIMTLLSDPDLQCRMGAAGYSRLTEEGYTWPAIAGEFEHLYGQVRRKAARREEPKEAAEFVRQITVHASNRNDWEGRWFMDSLFARKA